MGEIVEGLGASARERIAALRQSERFFWLDVSVDEASADDLGELLGLSADALDPLLDFREGLPPSRKFRADGRSVVFAFTSFLEREDSGSRDALEVHIVVTGGYVLTVHQERLSLHERLAPKPPEGRSEQYEVYAILDAMVASAFDALGDAEMELESLQQASADLRGARVRMGTLRALNSMLAAMRHRIGPQRGIFERVSEEIRHVEGLEGDAERYFERIAGQLNRLVDAIDAAGDGLAKLIDLRLNETIYWLTLVSTVFLPLTFVTGFFGMNFGWMVRNINTPLAFVVLGIGGCILGVVVTLVVVGRRGTPIAQDRPARVRRVARSS
jgi:magnesium transporter